MLDENHYRNWVITSVQNSDLDSLLIWIVIARTQRRDLIQQRQQGRRFAQALLEQLHRVSDIHQCLLLTADAK